MTALAKIVVASRTADNVLVGQVFEGPDAVAAAKQVEARLNKSAEAEGAKAVAAAKAAVKTSAAVIGAEIDRRFGESKPPPLPPEAVTFAKLREVLLEFAPALASAIDEQVAATFVRVDLRLRALERITTPGTAYRGVWGLAPDGTERFVYAAGDAVIHRDRLWLAQRAATQIDQPGASDVWQMAPHAPR